jgi:peptidoglycan-N-acetylglucosamine deacetylase
MPWKEGYTTTDEKSMNDREIRWPDNYQCVFSIVVDYSVLSGSNGIEPRDVEIHKAEFGSKVEAWKLLDLFAQYGVRATFAIPGVMAVEFGESVREIAKRGHEIASHGYRHEDISRLDKEEEKKRIDLTTQILERTCGKRPLGWFSLPRQQDDYAGGSLSSNTIDLLIDGGYEYLGNGMADDIPYYWVNGFHSRRSILTLPYYYHFDDQFFLMFPSLGRGSGLENPMSLFQNWKQEFTAAYQRGRYFSMFIHPYLIQWGNRLEVLEEFLGYIKQFPGLWNPTGNDCARYWKATYPPGSSLKLKESIWKDYPGSLS